MTEGCLYSERVRCDVKLKGLLGCWTWKGSQMQHLREVKGHGKTTVVHSQMRLVEHRDPKVDIDSNKSHNIPEDSLPPAAGSI